MSDNEHGFFWVAFTLGAAVGILVLVVMQAVGGVYDSRSIEDGDCIIVTSGGEILYDPVPGEDDGLVYCPTGEVSVSQIGDVVR